MRGDIEWAKIQAMMEKLRTEGSIESALNKVPVKQRKTKPVTLPQAGMFFTSTPMVSRTSPFRTVYNGQFGGGNVEGKPLPPAKQEFKVVNHGIGFSSGLKDKIANKIRKDPKNAIIWEKFMTGEITGISMLEFFTKGKPID